MELDNERHDRKAWIYTVCIRSVELLLSILMLFIHKTAYVARHKPLGHLIIFRGIFFGGLFLITVVWLMTCLQKTVPYGFKMFMLFYIALGNLCAALLSSVYWHKKQLENQHDFMNAKQAATALFVGLVFLLDAVISTDLVHD